MAHPRAIGRFQTPCYGIFEILIPVHQLLQLRVSAAIICGLQGHGKPRASCGFDHLGDSCLAIDG
ncbi:MAG: hypothetical protein LBT57_02565 [Puniceicoccales bacterium]|nr:hypothetical protein [Puniceicoccales bacterium]